MKKPGLLMVLSGPSGAGKGTVSIALQKEDPALHLSVSATTRTPRKGEREGIHYYFLDRDVFQRLIEQDELLEWAEVYGNYYGTLRKTVQDFLARGQDVMLEIDIQGALQVKERFPEAVLIFITPPSPSELRSRLIARGTEAPEEIEKRLSCAAGEMELAQRYDYIVINDQLTQTLESIRAVIAAEKLRPRYCGAFFARFLKSCADKLEGSYEPNNSR